MTTEIPQNGEYPRLLTIRKAAEVTQFPEYFIRTLVVQGRIKSVAAGKRKYVNMNSLLEYVNGGDGGC